MKIHPAKIAFDFDGVVADTFRLFVRLADSEFGIRINYESISDYNFLNVVKMDKALADKLIGILTEIPHGLDLLPNKGAVQILAKLSKVSPILFVTARPYGNPVENWLKKTMPDIKSLIRVEATGDNTTKLPFLKKNDIQYFVEDRLDTCSQLAEAGIIPIVYDQPWNRGCHSFKVVENWHDIDSLIEWQNL